jgi:hypothetical protein
MSATNYFETCTLKHIFQNAALSGIGDTTGLPASTAAGCLYVAIGTAMSDGEIPTFTEANYGAYARVGMCRSAAGWTVTNNVACNTAAVTFPQAISGTNCACYFAIFDCLTAGNHLINGTITTPLAISVGITPEFATGTLCVSLD